MIIGKLATTSGTAAVFALCATISLGDAVQHALAQLLEVLLLVFAQALEGSAAADALDIDGGQPLLGKLVMAGCAQQLEEIRQGAA